MNEFGFGLIGGFLGAFLGVLGTEVAKFLLEPSRRLETRRDSILADMTEEVQRIEQVGAEYWRGAYIAESPEIQAVEQDITAGLHGLIRDAGDLFEGCASAKADCEGKIRELRIIVTGGDFGDSQQLNDLQVALDVKTKCGDLKRSLRNRRHELKRRFL